MFTFQCIPHQNVLIRASLSNQLATGIPYLCLLGLRVAAFLFSFLDTCLVLTLRWQVLYPLSQLPPHPTLVALYGVYLP